MAKTIVKKEVEEAVALSSSEFIRLANNFYTASGMQYDIPRLDTDARLINYILANKGSVKKKFKVALVCICLNEPYWQYALQMLNGCRQFFLPGHDTDLLLWSDIPEKIEDEAALANKLADVYKTPYAGRLYQQHEVEGILQSINNDVATTMEFVKTVRTMPGVTIFPTEPIEWPYPTLLRYNLFLQQEEKLKDYDYVFYCDVDMLFKGIVGDEILGPGLTVAPHPGYYTRKEYWPPYEPNPESASYIQRPGKVVMMDGKPRFMPFYCAGGFQGGRTDVFLKAMRETKELIAKDMSKNYIPIWNDETAWNKYVFDMQTKEEIQNTIFLTPSYIYPDSLIQEYYLKIWGRDYPAKLVTITKKHSLRPMAATDMNNLIGP